MTATLAAGSAARQAGHSAGNGTPAGAPGPAALDFALPPEREAHEPPEARGLPRDGVALLVSRGTTGEISHHRFTDLPRLLLPGDLLVVNTSATLPAAVAVTGAPGGAYYPGQPDSGYQADPGGAAYHLGPPAPDPARSVPLPDAVHFSTPMPDGQWLVELRAANGPATRPHPGGMPGQQLGLPAGAALTLGSRFTARLWQARLSTAVIPYLLRHGAPIRYSYVQRPWPIESYQTVFGVRPGSAEMPSASRPFTPQVVAALVARGITFAPVTLHTGVSSLEGDEDPYPEPYDVPPTTARLVSLTRRHGGRVIAVGTTVVRALETAARAGGSGAGWTSHVVTPETGLLAVDGLITGLHEPRSTHLWMLGAFAAPDLLSRCYAAAVDHGYLWHEFGDLHLLLP
jgi:S-adenosylmethionine:tRNA ribosyltransferase-isomerase